jgi:hypothetical protein
MNALDQGSFSAAQVLAAAAPFILTMPDDNGMTLPMFFARRTGSVSNLGGLMRLMTAAHFAAIDNDGNKLLHYAAMNTNAKQILTTVLPFTSKDAGLPNKKGQTPLMLTAAYGTTADLLMLRPQKDDLHASDKDGVNATMYAIRHSNLNSAVDLMRMGGEVDFSDPAVETQLRVATYDGDFVFGQVVAMREQIQKEEKRVSDLLRAEQEKKEAIRREAEDGLRQEKLLGDITAAVKAGTKAIPAPETAAFLKRTRATAEL